MVRKCFTYGRNKKSVQEFGRKTCRDVATWETLSVVDGLLVGYFTTLFQYLDCIIASSVVERMVNVSRLFFKDKGFEGVN